MCSDKTSTTFSLFYVSSTFFNITDGYFLKSVLKLSSRRQMCKNLFSSGGHFPPCFNSFRQLQACLFNPVEFSFWFSYKSHSCQVSLTLHHCRLQLRTFAFLLLLPSPLVIQVWPAKTHWNVFCDISINVVLLSYTLANVRVSHFN